VSKITYNERSWAIDIISEIALFSSKVNKPIKRAGGESTINRGKKRFFPDVLLYGENSDILMGWELKMPDTSISDIDFIDNAKIKAEILGLNGFLLWNAKEATLYLLKNNEYVPCQNWDTSKGVIEKRIDVEKAREIWIESLHLILQDLNRLFESGTIQQKPLIDSFNDSSIIKFILYHAKENANSLKLASTTNSKFRAEVNVWWRIFEHEYDKRNQWEVLAEIILVNWIHKILFANILTAFRDDAKAVYDIDSSTTLKKATQIFKDISSTCDFWNIFQPQLGEEYITSGSWSNIVELNQLLKDIELASIGQELLQSILENVISDSKRKVAGQFTTPMALARLLVHFTLNDLTQTLHDPCCGTGTIPRATYDIKKEVGIDTANALSTIFASDKVAFPLQMATLAITEAENMGNIIQVFKHDASKFIVGQNIELRDPYDGSKIYKPYEAITHIASNLPFIRQEDLKILNPNIREDTENIIEKYLGKKVKLNAKSDLYAYLPFHFWELLEENGRLGIIISNSWLGTKWGATFKELLVQFFKIEFVITAGSGRWFSNAKVVTNILILEKKSVSEPLEHEITKFITIFKELNSAISNKEISILYENILTNTVDSSYACKEYKTNNIMDISLNWNALFGDISWIDELTSKLIYLHENFYINRGERRGWNPMFYPQVGHGIEVEYIRPVLKTPKDINTLITKASTEAFCCSKSIEELKNLNHTGALSWINKFRYAFNTSNKPLPDVLKKKNLYWYEMNESTMAHLATSVNPDKRLYFAKLDIKSFVDQRFIPFVAKNSSVDIDLFHALLNSILGIFFIESLGFGRGQEALDLSSERVKEYLRVLNPNLLTKEQITLIKNKFISIRDREIKNITDEFKEEDRIDFDNIVLEAFGILHLKDKIKNSFLYLYNMRTNVRV
jgi:hypothetical protein